MPVSIVKKAGLAPTKARPALHTNFCSTKSEEHIGSSSVTLIGLSTENEQSLIGFEKPIFSRSENYNYSIF
jgi:hypothetical protein